MEKRKSWLSSNIASGLHTCLLTLREYSRKWRKWQSNIEAMLLQYSMLHGIRSHWLIRYGSLGIENLISYVQDIINIFKKNLNSFQSCLVTIIDSKRLPNT